MMGTFKLCFEEWVRFDDVELGTAQLQGLGKA